MSRESADSLRQRWPLRPTSQILKAYSRLFASISGFSISNFGIQGLLLHRAVEAHLRCCCFAIHTHLLHSRRHQTASAPWAKGNRGKRTSAVMNDQPIIAGALHEMHQRVRAIKSVRVQFATRTHHFRHSGAAVRLHEVSPVTLVLSDKRTALRPRR